MKKTAVILFTLTVLLGSPLSAQTIFYGQYSGSAAAAIPLGADGTYEDTYATPLNPGNVLGLKDVSLGHDLLLKLSAGDEAAALEVWFAISQQTGMDPALFGQTGENPLYTLDLKRASVSWYMGDAVRIKLGRHSLLTGYGYGWNPMDFANPLKNPADPGADLTGVDSFLVHLFPFSPVNLKLYGVVDTASGVDYENLQAGGELTLALPFAEVKLTGLFDRDESPGEDEAVSALGAGVLLDLAGAGLYGEAALAGGSRTAFPDGTAAPVRKDDLLFSSLVGVEYTFLNELTLVAEYFYNGEGFDEGEREAYLSALEDPAMLAGLFAGDSDDSAQYQALAGLYRPGYFSRHYALVNLLYPLYDADMDLSATILFSADSGALAVLPMVTWYASGSLALEIGYSGMFSLYGEDSDESALSPTNHAVTLTGRFSF